MDIIDKHNSERQRRISILKANLQKAFDAGVSVDKNKFISVSCFELNISRRTLLEYLSILKGIMSFFDADGILKLEKKEVME